MKRLAFVLALALTCCASAAPPKRAVARVQPAVAGGAWSIELTSSGGFDGRGYGGLTLTSDGTLVITLRDGKTSCRYALTADELRAVDELVTRADATNWVASYALASNPHGCCDMFQTNLKLVRADGTFQTMWYQTVPPMPADLVALERRLAATDDASSLRSRYQPLCAPVP
jgi:hypothetical protein